MDATITKTAKTQSTTGLVLIAGAGLGPWVWQDVVSALDMPTLVISFPEAKLKKTMHLDDYARTALEQINSWHGIDKYVVVGHSIGAIIALQLAESLQNQVIGLAAIGSVIPRQGHSFFSTLPFPQNLLIPLITKLAGTRPPENAIKKSYCNDLSDMQATKVVQSFQPESYFLYADALTAKLPDVARLYVALSKDQNTPSPQQKVMADNLKATEIASLDTGHLPMLAQPEKLADILHNFAVPK
jgi:pimeloyl-ACP methyl ester carboxylesterase